MTQPLRVIVTAGGSGIGQAIAAGFANAGHHVHICDVDSTAVGDSIKMNRDIRGSIVDVADSKQVDLLYAEAMDWMGGVDVLINNAGIGGPNSAVENIEEEDWDRCLRVNLNGPFFMIRRAAPLMKAQRSGCIINISTTSARTGLPNRLPYVVSKVGLLGLSHNIARELGPWNIRCNAILPGTIDNARGRALIAAQARELGVSDEEARELSLSYVSMRAEIDPTEIAETAMFLASSAGRHISAQEIGVCGNVEWEI